MVHTTCCRSLENGASTLPAEGGDDFIEEVMFKLYPSGWVRNSVSDQLSKSEAILYATHGEMERPGVFECSIQKQTKKQQQKKTSWKCS